MNYCEYFANAVRELTSGTGDDALRGNASRVLRSGLSSNVSVYSNVDPSREWNGATSIEFNEPDEPKIISSVFGYEYATRSVYAIVRSASTTEAESMANELAEICATIASALLELEQIYAWSIDESGTTADARGIVEGESFYGYVKISITERKSYGG